MQINSNTNALFAQNALRANYSQTATAIQRLSTGVAINSAKDNAAGMAIGENLNSKIRGLTQSISNINDGINLLQTADGGAGSIQEMLQRIRELAVQSSNGSYSDTQRYYLNQEAISLQKEINQVIDATTWNGKTLLNGRFTNQIIQAGPDVDQSFSISIPTARLATMITGTGATTSVVNMAGQTDGTLDEQVTFGGGDAYLTQYSLDGTKNYTKLQGATANDSARGATTGWDGAIYITGVRDQTALTEGEDVPSITNDDPANNTASAYITKYSYDGQLVWSQTYEGVSFASGSDVAVGVDNYSTISTIANNGAVYVVGDAIGSINSQSSSGGLDKVLIKLAPDGTHQWTQQIASQQGIGISTAKDGSIYVSSFSSPTVSSGNLLDPIDSGTSTITLQKFSDTGTSLWSKQVQSNSSFPNGSVAVDQEDGSVYLTGQTFLPVDGETVVAADAFLTKLSSDGTTAWTNIIAQSANNFTLPSHVQVAPDGSVYLAGKTNANL